MQRPGHPGGAGRPGAAATPAGGHALLSASAGFRSIEESLWDSPRRCMSYGLPDDKGCKDDKGCTESACDAT